MALSSDILIETANFSGELVIGSDKDISQQMGKDTKEPKYRRGNKCRLRLNTKRLKRKGFPASRVQKITTLPNREAETSLKNNSENIHVSSEECQSEIELIVDTGLFDNDVEMKIHYPVNGPFEGLDYGPIYTVTGTSEAPLKTDDNLSMTWWAQAAWTIVFTLMITVAIGGNCIVMWIVIAHRRMRTVTNYFLMNLSTADLLLSTLNCFFNFIYMLQGHWQFGNWYCTINNFIAYVTVAASVFTLTGISCDRYLAIVHPLQPRMSKTSSLVTIVLIWIASMVSGFPCLLYSTTITYKYRNKSRTACILVWPDGQPTDSSMDFAYQVVFIIITYLVPMVLMICCYTAMGKVLWGSHSIGEMTQRQLDSIKSKRKVVRMFIFVVLIFALCWLPYHGYFIYTHYDRQILYSKYVQHVYLGFYWFAMANAMVNPLIYYWMNARFRQYFRTAICGWQTLFKRNMTHGGTETPPIIGRHSHSISKSVSTLNTFILYEDVLPENFNIRYGRSLQKSSPSRKPQLQRASSEHINIHHPF